MSDNPYDPADTAEFPVIPDGDQTRVLPPTFPAATTTPAPQEPAAPTRRSWGLRKDRKARSRNQARQEAQARRAARWDQPDDDAEPYRTVRRATGATRRRAFEVAFLCAIMSLAIYWGQRWGLVHFGSDTDSSRLAWQLPLVGCALLLVPPLIRLELPFVWVLPLPLAGVTGWMAWRSWLHTHDALPATCGAVGRLFNSCQFRHYPWVIALVFLLVLTSMALSLAWRVYEDSITVIEVDRSHRR